MESAVVTGIRSKVASRSFILATQRTGAIAIMSLSTTSGTLYFNHDASRLLAVPPECHQHAKDLETECRAFVEKLKAFKDLSRKIAADVDEAEKAVEADKERVEELRQRRLSGGNEEERSDELKETIKEKEAKLEQLEQKLEELEHLEMEEALKALA